MGLRHRSADHFRGEFCAECGTPLFAGGGIPASFIAIKVGSLDDPSWCALMLDIWTRSAQPWDVMNPALPKFPENLPPR